MRPLDPNFDQNIFVNNYQSYNKKETMKNIARYLIAALICLIAALYVGTAGAQVKTVQAKAYTPPDTIAKFNITFSQQEVSNQFVWLGEVNKRLHKIKIDALLRDTLDAYLGQSAQLLERKFRQAFVADSLSRIKVKPTSN